MWICQTEAFMCLIRLTFFADPQFTFLLTLENRGTVRVLAGPLDPLGYTPRIMASQGPKRPALCWTLGLELSGMWGLENHCTIIGKALGNHRKQICKNTTMFCYFHCKYMEKIWQKAP